MNCGRAQFWIQALADGELNHWRTRRLERHLLGCSACASQLATVQWMKRILERNREEIVCSLETQVGEREFFWQQVWRQLQAGLPLPGKTLPNAGDTVKIPRLFSDAWAWLPWYGRVSFVAVMTVALVAFLGATLFWGNNQIESLAYGPSEVSDIQTPYSNSHPLTYIFGDAGITMIWIYGLPPEFEEEENEL